MYTHHPSTPLTTTQINTFPTFWIDPVREKSGRGRVGAHTFRVPQKFPGCKGTPPSVFNSLSSCWGAVRGHLRTTPPHGALSYKRALLVQTSNKHTSDYCSFPPALRALRRTFSYTPLSSLLSNFLSFFSSVSLFLSLFFLRSASGAGAARWLRPASCFLMFHCEELPL